MEWLEIRKRDERWLEVLFLRYGDLQGVRSIPVLSVDLLCHYYGELAVRLSDELADECPPQREWREGGRSWKH